MPFTLVNSYHMLFSHFPLLIDRWEKSGLSMQPWSHQGPLQDSYHSSRSHWDCHCPCSREEGCTPMDMVRMHGRSPLSSSGMPPCQTLCILSTPRYIATGDLESTWPYMKPCLASAIMSDTYCQQIQPTVTMEGVMKMGTLWLPRATGTTCRPVGGT